MMSSRSKFPFTASQWQELEHQALIFKYMVSGIPIPADLLFTIKRSCLDPPLASKLYSRQPPHVGWSCLQMGLGRKIDPEPGRCRRTDGKKWRCSKEAYLDSKYCERHMHRGKNRSRKPVEVITTTPTTTTTPPTATSFTPNTNPSTAISSITKNPSQSLSTSTDTHLHHHLNYPAGYNANLNYPFSYSHLSSARPTGIGLSHEENSTHLVLDSGSSYSHSNTDYRNRYVYGLKDVDEHAFFSEPSGTMRTFSGSSMDDTWQLTPLTMSSSSSSKQRSCSGLQNDYSYLQLQSLTDHTTPKQHKQDQHSYILGSDIKCEMPMTLDRQQEEEPRKIVHRFFDEWPPKNRDSWLDMDDKSSNSTSVSTTRLSISIPSTSQDFPIFNSRAHNDG
ncbi:WRC domain-containing protein/QLQ domain-containing protein [Cephalotus follicularis]|uniref:Growth-regulating factor n=1 Tax=Cephalotus follicularis TaxID=3775 RepID=A0A1Q3BXP1_CEPFO|nr:WRC domain-containing protein/QLQ domain-containing protein [Cephalotus follicularis]